MTAPREAGRLRLVASRAGERTVLSDLFYTAPLHPGPAHRDGGAAHVIVQEVSPGLLPGDRLEIDICVDNEASLLVSAQGATRLYPSRGGEAAAEIALRVASGGTLWWLPGELIPFRDAAYRARSVASLESGARLAWLEIITPGRLAMGERDAYRRLDLRLRVEVAGQPLLIERALFDPAERSRRDPRGAGNMPCAATLVLVGYELPLLTPAGRDDVWLGADRRGELTLVRAVGASAASLRDALQAILMSLGEADPSPATLSLARLLRRVAYVEAAAGP